ncbi:hypothetical protein CDAR_604981 [Caerostris darwini]|uniref:Uncharacterized protein n=1 Tax=Caerostris darwini TaxID=1538125 RepID=A0AAV4X7J8_9ARAC|nr:hypothetical protein CDAR_604981 [Caerostris darwini]
MVFHMVEVCHLDIFHQSQFHGGQYDYRDLNSTSTLTVSFSNVKLLISDALTLFRTEHYLNHSQVNPNSSSVLSAEALCCLVHVKYSFTQRKPALLCH